MELVQLVEYWLRYAIFFCYYLRHVAALQPQNKQIFSKLKTKGGRERGNGERDKDNAKMHQGQDRFTNNTWR